MTTPSRDAFIATLRNTIDYPTVGNTSTDVSGVLLDPTLMAAFLAGVRARYADSITAVVGVDSMGFPFASMIALDLKVPLALTRKGHKILPNSGTSRILNAYKNETVGIRRGGLPPGARVLIVDDVMGSGGTFLAFAKIVEELGCTVVGGAHLVDLAFGGDKWPGVMDYPHYFQVTMDEREYDALPAARAEHVRNDVVERVTRKFAWFKHKATEAIGLSAK